MTTFKVINPYDESVYKEFTYTTAQEVDNTVKKLKKGMHTVAALTIFEKCNILYKLRDLIKKQTHELATIITSEMGKCYNDSFAEIERAQVVAEAAADFFKTSHGEVLYSDAYPPKRKKIGIVHRSPLGVLLAITPFNFPVNLPLHKICPGFLMGNAILWKPSPQNYASAEKLLDLCYEAGIPKDCLALICPDIPVLTDLIKSNNIQCISFTGGRTVANAIAKNAGRKKLLFELGGNDPLIVMADANLKDAAKTCIIHRFGCAGQRCTAAKRIFIHKQVYCDFRQILLDEAKSLVIGNPMDKRTFIGPVVTKAAADTIENRIHAAVKNGAKCILGNKRKGNIIHPTILENVEHNSELILDETFGPVLPLFEFTDIDTVIETVNSSDFGLQAGLFTYDTRTINQVFEKIQVGTLVVNDGPGFRCDHFPFGGVKDSGSGREGVKYAMEELSTTKTLVM